MSSSEGQKRRTGATVRENWKKNKKKKRKKKKKSEKKEKKKNQEKERERMKAETVTETNAPSGANVGTLIPLPLDVTREDLLHEAVTLIRRHLPAREDGK